MQGLHSESRPFVEIHGQFEMQPRLFDALTLSDELESLDGHRHQDVLSLRSPKAGTCEVSRRPREPDELPIRHSPDRS